MPAPSAAGGLQTGCAGSEGLPAAHNWPVHVQVLCLGLTQSFFHAEITLGALGCGKMLPSTTSKRSVAV